MDRTRDMLRDALMQSRPELRALALCARATQSSAQRAELSALFACGLAWDALLRAAEYHGLTSLLARHVHGELVALCPGEPLARLRAAAHGHVAKSFALTAELIDALAALRGAGIPALALKGPVSAALCYGDFGARVFMDLDVLIDPSQVDAATRVLHARGYTPHLPLTGVLLERLVRTDSELLLRHADGVRLLDLHWALLPRGYSFSPDAGGPFAERQSVRVGTADVPTLGVTATLLFMLLHGIKHDWACLGWLCDAAELVKRASIDWDELLAWSAPAGRRRLIDVGLLLAHGLLDAPVPDAVLRRARADARAASVALQIARSVLRPELPSAPRSPLASSIGLAYFRAMELPGDRVRFLHDVVLRPTPLEWNALPLPGALSALHYLVRPVRLVIKHAPRPWSRS